MRNKGDGQRNICFLLNELSQCSAYDHITLCRVVHERSMIGRIPENPGGKECSTSNPYACPAGGIIEKATFFPALQDMDAVVLKAQPCLITRLEGVFVDRAIVSDLDEGITHNDVVEMVGTHEA